MDATRLFYKGHWALLLVALLAVWQVQVSMQNWRSYQEISKPISIAHPTELPPRVEVASLHLYGQPPQKSMDPNKLPLSDLNFTLVGIFLAKNPTDSEVLLDTGSGDAVRYRQGDVLPEGVKLYKILRDAVILEREGQYESLPLDKESLNFEELPSELPMSNDN